MEGRKWMGWTESGGKLGEGGSRGNGSGWDEMRAGRGGEVRGAEGKEEIPVSPPHLELALP